MIIAYLAFEPNFLKGSLLYLESGWYASAVNEIFHGKTMFKDFYFLYGPLSAYGPAGLMVFFGKSLVVLRAYFLVSNILSFVIIGAICRRVIPGRFWGVLASLVCVMDAHHPNWCSRWGGLRFTLGYLAILTAILFMKGSQRKYLLLAGIFSALCFFHGYDIGLFSFLSIGSMLLVGPNAQDQSRSGSWRGRMRDFGIYLIGVSAVFLGSTIWLFSKGSLGAFASHLVNLGASAGLAQPFGLGSRSVIKFLYPAVSFLLSFLFFRKDRALLLCAVYGTFLYGYSFRAPQGPQFEASLPMAILCSFYVYERLFTYLRKKGFSRAVSGKDFASAALAVFLVVGVSYNIFSQKRFYHGNVGWWAFYQASKFHWIKDFEKGIVPVKEVALETLDERVERAQGLGLPPEQADEIRRTVSYIRANTRETEEVLSFPDLGTFNFLCDRPSPGRYPMSGTAWFRPDWGEEFMRDLEKSKPRLAVLSTDVSDLFFSVGPYKERCDRTLDWIRAHYHPVQAYGTILLYERN